MRHFFLVLLGSFTTLFVFIMFVACIFLMTLPNLFPPKDYVLAEGFLLMFVLICAAYLSEVLLYIGLKYTSPDAYMEETKGRGFLAHIGSISGMFLLTVLDSFVARIAKDESNDISQGVRRYAVGVRYLNIFKLTYIVGYLAVGVIYSLA